MKRKLIFCEYVMRDIIIYSLIIGAVFFLVEQFSFMLSFSAGPNLRFSNELDEANFRIIFISALILTMAALVFCVMRRFIGSKGIYGLLMMPVPRLWLWGALLVSGALAIIILILFRYLSGVCAHAQYVYGIERYVSEQLAFGNATSAKVENNALFTAFLRCDSLRMFLPYTFTDGAMLFFTIFSLPALTLRFSLSIFAKKLVSGVILTVLWILFFILLAEMEFLGFVGLATVSVWAYLSSKSMIQFGQMI